MNRVILLVLLLASTVNALPAWVGQGPATDGKYYEIDSLGVAITAEANAQSLCPAACTIKSLTVWLSAAPGAAGKTWTVTVRNNAGNTAATVTIENAATTGTYTGDVAVAEDDNLSIAITSANTPAAATAHWWVTYSPTTANTQLFMGRGTTLGASAVRLPCKYSSAGSGYLSGIVFSTAGTISNLHGELSAAPGEGAVRKVTCQINGSPSSPALAKSVGEANTYIADDSNSVSVSVGNYVRFDATVTAGTAAASNINYGFVFTPTVTERWMLSTAGVTAASTSVATYFAPSSLDQGNATETTIAQYVQAIKIINCYVQLSVAPGAGKSYALDLRDDTANSSPQLQVVIADSATSGNATATVEVAANSLLDTSMTPAGTPTASYPGGISYTIDDSVAESGPTNTQLWWSRRRQ